MSAISTRLTGAALALALATGSCTEQPLTGPDPGQGPGESSETVEIALRAGEISGWRDTTFRGFAAPGDANFLLVADQPTFRARSLLRFRGIPDSIVVDSVNTVIEEFEDPTLAIVVDSARSELPAGGFRFRLFRAPRSWDEHEATWERGAEGEPWAEPGGALADELGVLAVEPSEDPDSANGTSLGDTLRMPLNERGQEAIREWQRRDGEPGAVLVVEESGARLRLESVGLFLMARAAGQDSASRRIVRGLTPAFFPSTFIHDPPQPEPGEELRLGGLPANRFYFQFDPPDTARGVPIRGGTVNRAQLIFRPRPPPDGPFRLSSRASVDLIELAADFAELGARTPIERRITAGAGQFDPDVLAAGDVFRVPVTGLMQRIASAPPDSAVAPVRLGLRVRPEAQGFGFWEFGSLGADPAMQPVLRLVVTPPSPFELP